MKNYSTYKFKSLVIGATFSTITSLISNMIVVIALGNAIGSDAVAALNTLIPCGNIMIFLALLVVDGTCIKISAAYGSGDIGDANRAFTMGTLSIVAFSLIGFVITQGFSDPILKILFVGVDQGVVEIMRGIYFPYTLYASFFVGIPTYILCLTLNEGEAKLPIIASVVNIITVILCSFLFRNSSAGIVFALPIGELVSLVILLSGFRKIKLRFKWSIHLKDFFDMVKCGSSDAFSFFCAAVFLFVVNRFLHIYFPTSYVAIFGVLLSILNLCIIFFDGVGHAMQPLLCIYFNEENTPGIQKTLKIGAKTAVLESTIATIALLLLAQPVAQGFGFSGEEMLTLAASIRILAVSFIFFSLIKLTTSFLSCIDKVHFSVMIVALSEFLLPLISILLLGSLFQNELLWLCYLISGGLTLVILGFVLIVFKKPNLTILGVGKETQTRSFDFELNPKNVSQVMRNVKEILETSGYEKKLIMRAELVIEEHFIVLLEDHQQDAVCCELTLFQEDAITIIMRDTSQREYTAPTEDDIGRKIIGRYSNYNYFGTLGNNRVIYNIKKEDIR